MGGSKLAHTDDQCYRGSPLPDDPIITQLHFMPDYLALINRMNASITAVEVKILTSFVRGFIALKPFLSDAALVFKTDADLKGSGSCMLNANMAHDS